MLRLIVLLLLLANGLYFAWSHELLRPYGLASAQQSEPQRLAQQIRPEALTVLMPAELRVLEAQAAVPVSAPVKPTECLQAGLFDDSQVQTLSQALAGAMPAGAWVLEPVVVPARWMVYMGKFANAEALAKKRGELASMNLKFEPVTTSELALGLSLGSFATTGEAEAELAAVGKRGIRTARVVQERAEVRGTLLRLPVVDEGVRARLEGLKPALAGLALRACK